MNDAPGKSARSNWLWIVVLIVLLILVIGWFVSPSGKEPAPVAQPTAPSSEWVASPATEAGVPVTLPTAAMAPATQPAGD